MSLVENGADLAEELDDDAQLGRLLMYAISRKRPSHVKEYGSLLKKLNADPAFQRRFERLAEGSMLRMLDYSLDHGIVLGAVAGSPFAGKADDFFRRGLTAENLLLNRAVRTAALIAVAAAAFPSNSEVSVSAAGGVQFTAADVVEIMKKAAAQTISDGMNGDEGEHLIEPEEVIARGIDEMRTESDGARRSTTNLHDNVSSILTKLAEFGYIQEIDVSAEKVSYYRGTWMLGVILRDAADREFIRKLRKIAATRAAAGAEA